MGVWIETAEEAEKFINSLVTPFVGVWIETLTKERTKNLPNVTPFVGVWIETWLLLLYFCLGQSHPSWVCGLKLQKGVNVVVNLRHTLRGCVD